MKKLISLLVVGIAMQGCGIVAWFYPPMNIWIQESDGKAELAKADFSKQVAVQTAKASEESATYLANAEVKRAEGVARANKIIGDSLKDNEGYLRYLYIEGLKERTGAETIYVPTEAGLPILEAGHRK
jgi:regulator of protease activity HflC (stomatin/prohibitin superfamily)